jgi:GT2 family glycosyltransferase
MTSFVFEFPHPAELDITLVIVSFNTREILLRCLGSIKKHTQEISYEVIIIDNASEDGTVEALVELFPEVEVIANKDNRGFSAANNQGIVASKGRRVALLNPDTLLTENSFKKIINFMEEHPEYSILGTGIVDENNQPCPIRLWEDTPQDAVLKIIGLYNPASELKKMGLMRAKEAKVISGCCFVVSRDLIESIGLMDENYFLYNEEDDLCRRARKVGKKICFYPETSVQHLHGQSTHQDRYRKKVMIEAYRSNLYFYSKYYSCIWNSILRSLYKMTFLLGLLRSAFRHLKGSAKADDSMSLRLKLLLMSSGKSRR